MPGQPSNIANQEFSLHRVHIVPVAELRLVRRLHSAFYVSNFRDEVLSDRFQGLWVLLDGLSTDEAVDCEGNGRFNPFSIFAEDCAAEHAAGDSSYNLRKTVLPLGPRSNLLDS